MDRGAKRIWTVWTGRRFVVAIYTDSRRWIRWPRCGVGRIGCLRPCVKTVAQCGWGAGDGAGDGGCAVEVGVRVGGAIDVGYV